MSTHSENTPTVKRRAHNFKDLSGRRFGKMLVLHRGEDGKRKGQVKWTCLCDCGEKRDMFSQALQRSDVASCGCFQRAITGERFRTHGYMSGKRHPLVSVWSGIITRTENPNYNRFQDYGGRGIKMCERWRSSFPNFLEDMGERPTSHHSIDRIDNNLGYFKENCRWATKKEQANNKRCNIILTIDGEVKRLADWAVKYNIPKQYITTRLFMGWTPERAVKTEVKRRKTKTKP